ncbi:FAD-linked oxidase [Kiloniella spongiae]|uniref:FAD-linked oxidase n=1 Tax=Kiloniella spongiae TaxID=1489064 RepID=A0A0H2MIN6_9PROT|nr:FAD-binding oxidoreductase [Kiloniella spongiae]KLN62031.1 FAD-linked oxidase [Kiloniella spongiae]
MLISGWGQYPDAEAEILNPVSGDALQRNLQDEDAKSFIARGLGRSYGDSSLSSTVISTKYLNRFHSFDDETGILSCDAGVSLDDILDVFVPKGWFPTVTPGTRFVTVGGAIASDVHGKNHHNVGTFCDHVLSFRILIASGEIFNCSPSENRDLFLATCGGMGLTGVILDASIRLQKIESSFIEETTYKAANLKECLELFTEYRSATYSVAWIDCLKQGKELGRSLLMLGNHSEKGGYVDLKKATSSIPFNMPGFCLNKYSVGAFNSLYYGRVRAQIQERHVHYGPYFYPLDGIGNWTRLYGAKGFVQYQFVIPKDAGLEGMTCVLEKISQSGAGSFLSVLKVFGKGNDNLLSFPFEGYTLALDFKVSPRTFELLDQLDVIVHDYGGRIYLTKDARMSDRVFQKGYPEWEAFQSVRERYGAVGIFASLQSKRLGLDVEH